MQTKTIDMTLLKDSIHLYLQRAYTATPATERKNEYHRRVSPIVRMGGRSSDTHIPMMKARNTAEPQSDTATAPHGRRALYAATAPAIQHAAATAPYHNS